MLFFSKFPDIITILQKRFKYILIDETQDMQFHQLELIDKLFNNTTCILQRVGDPNQSIYNKVVDCCLWTPRNAMFLNNSMRLTKEIADVVNAFTLNRGNDGHGNARFVVSGRRELNNSIAPILILYDEKTMSSLENVFREQITLHNLQNTVEGLKYGFHIIGWNAKETEEEFNMNRLRLEEIFPNYIKTTVSSKSTYNTLCEYIQCQHPSNTIGECYKTILHSLCKILRLSNKKDVSNKYYTIKSIEQQYKNIDYNLFRKKLLLISMAMVEANYKNAYEQLVDYIRKDFLPHFCLGANDIVNTFIGEKFTEYIPEAYQENTQEIPIIIGTVHSVKGMTHCATMYVETFFHKYECKHLIKQDAHGQIDASPYFKDTINITTSRGKQAMKMLYVGMSRPTHLLCYATLKTNWDDISLQKMQDTGWDILDLTI